MKREMIQLAAEESNLQLQLLTLKQEKQLATSLLPSLREKNQNQQKKLMIYAQKVYQKQLQLQKRKNHIEVLEKDKKFLKEGLQLLNKKIQKAQIKANIALKKRMAIRDEGVLGYRSRFIVGQKSINCEVIEETSENRETLTVRNNTQICAGRATIQSKYPFPTSETYNYYLTFYSQFQPLQNQPRHSLLNFQLGITNKTTGDTLLFAYPSSKVTLNGQTVEECGCCLEPGLSVRMVVDCGRKVMGVVVGSQVVITVDYGPIAGGRLHAVLSLCDSSTTAIFNHSQ